MMSNEQLPREHEQLVREQGLLGMPFLNEDLPFLAEFNGYPEVSIERALEIVQTENSNITAAAAENASVVEHDMGAFNAPEVGFEDLMANYTPSTSTIAETAPELHMFDAPEIGADDLFANPAAATIASTSSSGATSTIAAPDANAFKKSCKICATRKIKCEIIAGSNPRLCKYCQEKGLACEFELKKSRQSAQS